MTRSIRNILVTAGVIVITSAVSSAQTVDYSILSVPEETGIEFVKITRDGDNVVMPEVRHQGGKLLWWANRTIAASPDGANLAYLGTADKATDIYVKPLANPEFTGKLTNRGSVIDFSYSPDGKEILFSEARGNGNEILATDAVSGSQYRQLTSGAADYAPVYAPDRSLVFFTRAYPGGTAVSALDLQSNEVASDSTGMNPWPLADGMSVLMTRPGSEGRSEIWRVNYATGEAKCIAQSPVHNFTSPMVSPDGKWIVFVGDGHIPTGNGEFVNTDIFAAPIDGSALYQLTRHAADDISPVWSADGKHIYFVSRRGDANGTPNVWRMTFNK